MTSRVVLLLFVVVCGVRATSHSHHINVCNYLPTDEELAEIAEREGSNDVNEYSHKVIHIKKYAPHEHILFSVLENETGDPQEFLYLAQAVQHSGKPVGRFKSFDEDLTMRKCNGKNVFLNDENADIADGEPVAGGVTFEWVAPSTKYMGHVTVIVTKVNMNLLHRHHHEDTPKKRLFLESKHAQAP